MTTLESWESFYVIVGSSAGALIGLQFVVLTLIADMPVARTDEQAGNAFATPSVVHFGATLFLSAAASAPWEGIGALATLWGVLGVCGVVYAAIVARRMNRQTAYHPVLEDWLFHLVLPMAAYALVVTAACVARLEARTALFLVGGAALLLLFIGIHNAWDAVAYQVFVQRRRQDETERQR